MSEGWVEVRLGDVAHAHKATVNPAKLGASIVDHYSLPAFDNGKRPERVPADTIKSNKLAVPPGCVLVSRLNPHIPRIWIPQVDLDAPSMCSTEFAVLLPTACEPEFLSYFVESDEIYGRLGESVNGTSSSHQRVSLDHLLDLRAPMPPPDEQRRIAEVLGALDDRIDTAGRLIGLLSAAAQALSSTAPRTCAVSDLARTDRVHWYPGQHSGEAIDHYSLPAFDAGVGAVRTEASEIASNKFQVRGPRVLFSRLNPDTSRTWLCIPSSDVSASVCSTEYAVLVAETTTVGQLWAVLSSGEVGDLLAAASTGTSASHQRVREDAILGATVADPRSLSMADQHAIDAYADSVVEKVRELKSLREARDFLLPRLVAGELRVAAAEEQVEAAT
jgi:type I restriction enzyme S subunit